MAIKLTTEEFVEKARRVHGDTYDYSLVAYENSHKPVAIICKVHGVWLQKPNNHLTGKGCGHCKQSVLKTQETIIAEFVSVHGDRYDYSKVEYVGADSDVEIFCRKHNSWFKQSPRVHKRGGGCNLCANLVRSSKRQRTLASIIKDSLNSHPETFDHNYTHIKSHSPLMVAFRCLAGGHEFEQDFHSHLNLAGCPICSGRKHGDVNIFKSQATEVHKAKYGYNLVGDWVTDKNYKYPIMCVKHGVFYQSAGSHLRGDGCPSCGKQDSKAELEVHEFVTSLGLQAERRDRKTIGKELDILIPEKIFAIEYNGLYWHSDNPKNNNSNPIHRHKDKTDACKAKGVHLFHLYEDDWLNKPEVVKHTIKHLLGMSERKVYARQTAVKTQALKEIRDFYEQYHMQGAPYQGVVSYCLYIENELVAAMTFSSPSSERGNTESQRYELLRYACKYSIVGGASKLFKTFMKDYAPKSVVSYSDDGMFSGKMYELMGFQVVGKVKPDYKVIVGKERKHKSGFRRKALQRILGENFNSSLSEKENCHNNGLYRIYNSGLTKWEFVV